MKYSEVRGFNYQPSYGSTSFENIKFTLLKVIIPSE